MAIGKKQRRGGVRLQLALVGIGMIMLLCAAGPCLAGPGVTVALLPMEAAGVLADVGAGVRTMLTSRLAGREGMAMVEPARVDRVLAELGHAWDRHAPASLFEPLGAAYLLGLGLQAVDDGWQLRAELFDPFVTDHPVHTFQFAGKASHEILPAVDRLAVELARFLKDREKTVKEAVAPAAAGKPGSEEGGFRTMHPEKSDLDILFYSGVYRLDGAVANFPLAMTLKAMDVGDVDGDGEDEVVLASGGEIVVRKMRPTGEVQLASFALPNGVEVHGLSIADLNHNGRQEIYISALATDMPRSFILEWNAAGLTVLAKDLGWYIRVLNVPGEGAMLAGQRFDAVVAGQLFWLRWQDGVLVADRKVVVPKDIDLFNFALADLNGDGTSATVSLDAGYHLQVHDAQGALLWRSDELYGANGREVSGRHVEGELIPLFEPTRQRLPVPCRIVVADFNGDGKSDIVVNENADNLATVFAGADSGSGTTIFGFSWDGRRLRKVWDTAPVAGHVLDYQLRAAAVDSAKNNGPGQHVPVKLYVAAKGGQGLIGMPGEQRGQILVFEMDLGWL